jgi:hypothetical protein
MKKGDDRYLHMSTELAKRFLGNHRDHPLIVLLKKFSLKKHDTIIHAHTPGSRSPSYQTFLNVYQLYQIPFIHFDFMSPSNIR